jgi:hypothetical protein
MLLIASGVLLYAISIVVCHQVVSRRRKEPEVHHPAGPEGTVDYTASLLLQSDELFTSMFRVDKPTFLALVEWLETHISLKSTRYMTLQQKVMIFLFIIAQGAS